MTQGDGFSGCFAGVYRMRLGPDARLVIPQTFREQLRGDTVMLGLGPRHGIIVILPPEVWSSSWRQLGEATLAGLALNCDEARIDRYLSFADSVAVSAQGRITLPRCFIAWAGLDPGEVMLWGLGNKILVMSLHAFGALMTEAHGDPIAALDEIYT
jgi:DNA-binding transcriptional regulator/RsmH inhibitor MraZ